MFHILDKYSIPCLGLVVVVVVDTMVSYAHVGTLLSIQIPVQLVRHL